MPPRKRPSPRQEKQHENPAPCFVDLPAPWFQQLLETLGPKELVATSQTCQTLQHEVLTGRDVTLTARMHEPGAEHRHISLQRACQLAAPVHLKLSGRAPVGQQQQEGGESEQAQQPAAPATSTQPHHPVHTAQAYLTNAVTSLGPVLMDNVTRATLQSMSLDALVPSWLTDACPQLTSLCLDDITLTLPDHPTHPAPNTTLKHLAAPAAAFTNAQGRPHPALSHHLNRLHGLQQLTVTTAPSAPLVVALSACTVVKSQLTALRLSAAQDNRFIRLYHLDSAAAMSRLTHLDVTRWSICDEALQMLQRIPTLTHLSCRMLDLAGDHTQEPCSWRHLSVQFFQVEGLTKLPLQGLQSITVRPASGASRGHPCVTHCSGLCMSTEQEVNDRVLAEVQRMGGLRWDFNTECEFVCAAESLPGGQQRRSRPDRLLPVGSVALVCTGAGPMLGEVQLGAVVQLLSSYQPPVAETCVMVDMQLNPATLQLLAQIPYITSTYVHHRWHLYLRDPSVDGPAVWPALLPAVHRYYRLTFIDAQGELTQQQLMAMCGAMPRPPCVIVAAGAQQLSADRAAQLQLMLSAQGPSAGLGGLPAGSSGIGSAGIWAGSGSAGVAVGSSSTGLAGTAAGSGGGAGTAGAVGQRVMQSRAILCDASGKVHHQLRSFQLFTWPVGESAPEGLAWQ